MRITQSQEDEGRTQRHVNHRHRKAHKELKTQPARLIRRRRACGAHGRDLLQVNADAEARRWERDVGTNDEFGR
jgi:hypothetical protein